MREAIAHRAIWFNEYFSKKDLYDRYSQSADEEIKKINEQMSSLGLFSFSKKKMLNSEITELQEKVSELKEACDTAKKEYQALI